MTWPVAVVASACEFPEGRTPQELWSTVLHGRRCFRRLQPQRIALDDYAAAECGADGIGVVEAALLEGYRFDRERFRVPQSSFDRTDMSHWLALDVATRALSDLDPGGVAAERDTMAVIVANTLTGEFSRANLMRYRWPYVARRLRTVAAAHLAPAAAEQLLQAFEAAYKSPFPAPDEDSLAGGLANTIAGRIANHHGLRGGAHTVDGACASSLVAVLGACERLAMGDVGCVLVGAVDLSLDPFELVGFARNGALAPDLMRVFDEQSSGFWPGEGCGFVVLANAEVARRHGWPVLAWLRGAAMSTDGEGALTRPTVEGQLLAAQRAWAQAGLAPADCDYFEAHGTGTPTGDPVELAGLAGLLGSTLPARPIAVGSIKANIGHTKAAAGIAGLLKAIAICGARVVPATSGCDRLHPVLHGAAGERVNVRRQAEPINHDKPVTVGVNSFGFGGVNCHVVVQGAATVEPALQALPGPERSLLAGELFMLQAASRESLASLLDRLERRARTLSRAQLTDLAFALGQRDGESPGWRGCVVASTPQELGTIAAAARVSLQSAADLQRQFGDGWCWSAPAAEPPRVAWLFPGQGLPLQLQPAAWAACFPALHDSARRAQQFAALDPADTGVAQPLLAEVALAGIDMLRGCGLAPALVFGHSFGELPALHAAGRIDGDALRRLAAARGACMRDHAPHGAMLAVQATRNVALELAAGHDLELACENGRERCVLSGNESRIAALAVACAAQGIRAERLPTTRAFHSRWMNAAQALFAQQLAQVRWQPARLPMVSSVTGGLLDGSQGLSDLLAEQLVRPVEFAAAIDAVGDVDLVIEIAAMPALGGLVGDASAAHVCCSGVFGDSLKPLLSTLGAVWTCGGSVAQQALFAGRLVRPCDLDDDPVLLANPCGEGSDGEADPTRRPATPPRDAAPAPEMPADPATARISGCPSSLETLRSVVARLTGLAASGLEPQLRLLADLHLNSIRARHALALAARQLGLSRLPFELARLANASLAEAAVYLDRLRAEAVEADDALPDSIAPWLRLLSHAWCDSGVALAAPDGAVRADFDAVVLDDSLAPIDPACHALPGHGPATRVGCALVALPAAESPAVWRVLLRAAKRLLADPGPAAPELQGLLVLQGAQLANGFMQSLAAEVPHKRLCVVETDALDARSLRVAIDEYRRVGHGYSELRLRDGRLQRRVLAPAGLAAAPAATPLSARSVVLVSGGARGIGAATALALARRFACKLALVGRSSADLPEVQATLAALRAAGSDADYFRADLSEQVQAREAVQAIESRFGAVTALFHAAGVNRPTATAALDEAEFEATLASKVDSLDHLLRSLPAARLDLLVGYGSIIGEFGLAGEAHYALANEWLARALARQARAAPSCRVLSLCWSAWRETGMAARIDGVLDGLRRAGTRALASDEAIAALERLLDSPPAGAVIVSGRYGRAVDLDDLRLLQPHRYLERPRVFYPGIELVADASLCSDADRYLQDHAPFGVPVLPLVCALEAMVGAAQCLWRAADAPVIDGLRVGEALSCAPGQRFLMRTSALVDDDGSVRAEVRSETTGFDVVHFSARLSRQPAGQDLGRRAAAGTDSWPAAELLYQGLAFHGPRLQRLWQVTAARATHCEVRTRPDLRVDWSGPLLAQGFAAGDPGLRDAALQALQLCLPHQLVLPVAAERIVSGRLDPAREYVVSARQVCSDGRRFVFDIQVCETSGEVVEQWTGVELLLSAGATTGDARRPLAVALLPPLIERIASDLIGAGAADAAAVMGVPAGEATAAALELALGRQVPPRRRSDGAFTLDGINVSSSHAGPITVALARASGPVAIDLQFLTEHDLDDWRLMLGEQRLRFATQLSGHTGLALQQALGVAWTASECLLKLDRSDWPLARARFSLIATSHIGPVLKFDLDGLQMAVATLAIAGASKLATLAVAVGRSVEAAADSTAADSPRALRSDRVATAASPP